MEADHPQPESAPSVAVADARGAGPTSSRSRRWWPWWWPGARRRTSRPAWPAWRDSDYPDLTVLVMVPAGTDLQARVAAVLPRAFVRPVEADGFAAAANDALATVAGAPFLLFCHDDVVLDPNAVRLLVEEAYRSNAAVVGPEGRRRRSARDPPRGRVVGRPLRRAALGHRPRRARPGAARRRPRRVLRRRALRARAGRPVRGDGGLSTPRAIPARPRSTSAGAPVSPARGSSWRRTPACAITAPTVSSTRAGAPPPGARAVDVDVDRAVALDRAGRARRAVRRGARVLRPPPAHGRPRADRRLDVQPRPFRRGSHRAAAGTGRRVSSATPRSTRCSSAGARACRRTWPPRSHAPDRVRALSDRSRNAADTAGARLRSVRGIVLLAMLALVAIGVRDLVFGRVAAVGTLLPWPGVGDLLRGFTSEWRYAGLGSHAPAPPLFVLAALLRVVTLGAGGFGRTLVVVGAIPVGMFGAYRLARELAGRGWPPLVTAVVLRRGAAAAERDRTRPRRCARAVRRSRPSSSPRCSCSAGLVDHRWPRRRIAALGGVGLAIAAAWWPLAILLPLVVLVGLALAAPAER